MSLAAMMLQLLVFMIAPLYVSCCVHCDKIENWKSSGMLANELRPQSAVVDGKMS